MREVFAFRSASLLMLLSVTIHVHGRLLFTVLAQGCLLSLVVPRVPAAELNSNFVLRGTLSDQQVIKEPRRHEAPFELIASEGEFRIRSLDPASKPPLAQFYASDYHSSYLSTLVIKDGAPDEKLSLGNIRYGLQLDRLPPRIGFVVWTWLASRLPASGDYDARFLALAPPEFVTQRTRRRQTALLPEIVRDRAGHVTGVRLWANLGEDKPKRLEPSGMVYLAAELIIAPDASGRPGEASLTIHALRPGKEHASRLRTEPVRRLTYRADAVPLADPSTLERITFLPDRDPPTVFVHDYRFPNDSVRGYRAYRLEAGQPLPFDPMKAPPGNLDR